MKPLRVLYGLLVICFFVLSVQSCSDDDDKYFNLMPTKIREFVVQYYPNPTVDNVIHNSDGWLVILKDGPSMQFNSTQDWYSVDGNGMPLPEVFVFDQFPEPLYRYLSETQNTLNVFAVSRSKSSYMITLLDSKLKYDIESGKTVVI